MNIRRVAGIAALCAAASTVVVAAPGAGADEVTYGAASDGRALHLSLFGEGLTAGQTHSDIGSAPEAKANGAGIANPLAPVGTTDASVDTDGTTDGSSEQNCEGSLPEIPGLSIDLACSASTAAIAEGHPASASTAQVGTIQLNPVGAILDTPLADVVDDVQAGLAPLLDGLGQALGPIDDATDLGLEDTVDDLVELLLDGAPLATVTVGATESSTLATAEGVTTSCSSTGARVDVLDLPAVAGAIDPPPFLSVIVGEAGTSVSVDGTTGSATPSVEPALVRVVVPSLDLDIPVEVGDPIEIPLPEPLGTSVITVAGGSTGTEDGQTFARSSAVSLDLLNGEGLMGGIELALADCASVAGASITQTPTPKVETPAPAPTPEKSLPRTGGTAPNGAALAVTVGLAGLALALLRRSRTA